MTHNLSSDGKNNRAAHAQRAGLCCGWFARTGSLVFVVLVLPLGLLSISLLTGCTRTVLTENDAGRGDAASTASAEAAPSEAGADDARDTGAAATGAAPRGTTSANAEPVWHEDFAKGLKHAAEQDKPVLVRFSASWCMPCRVMDANVWPDEQVKTALAQHAIPVKIDVDDEAHADVVQRYGVRAVPTLLLVDARGEELARGGFMNTEAVIEFLRQP